MVALDGDVAAAAAAAAAGERRFVL